MVSAERDSNEQFDPIPLPWFTVATDTQNHVQVAMAAAKHLRSEPDSVFETGGLPDSWAELLGTYFVVCPCCGSLRTGGRDR